MMPSPDGGTVQVNGGRQRAVAVLAVTVTVEVPAVVGVPLIVPPEIAVPAGSPLALNVSDWPLVESARRPAPIPRCLRGLPAGPGW